jgi:hypothetical protein
MAAIVWTDVTDVASEFVSVPTPLGAQTLFLALVNGPMINVDNFGGEDRDLTKAARIFLAAHFETMRRRRGVAGTISSQSEGGVSQAYTIQLMNPRVLDQTSYGQSFRLVVMGTGARAGQLVTGN